MVDTTAPRRGPRRPAGAPAGPEEVRRALLDSAARLFSTRGLHAVALRDIAADADVQLALISRYIGSREDLLLAVFDDLSDQLAAAIARGTGEQHSYGPDSVMSRWVRVAGELVLAGHQLAGRHPYNPIASLAKKCQDLYGIDETAARLRAAQIVGSVMGWRLFEDYLVDAAELTDLDRQLLRDEVTATHHRIAAVPWPALPDRGRSADRVSSRR